VAMLLVALLPALVAAHCLSRYVTRVLYDTLWVSGVTFVLGGIAILLIERFRPPPVIRDVDATPIARRSASGCVRRWRSCRACRAREPRSWRGLVLGLDRPVATEFSFFLAIPTLTAAFANSCGRSRHEITSAQVSHIAIGFVMAFISSALVVRPFLNYVRAFGISVVRVVPDCRRPCSLGGAERWMGPVVSDRNTSACGSGFAVAS